MALDGTNDYNAKILTRTPVSIPIILPKTPSVRADIEQREEEKCTKYFTNHEPVLTPANVRMSEYTVYSLSLYIFKIIMLNT